MINNGEKTLVFVYGSLLKGLSNFQTLVDAKAEFVSDAVTVDTYYMTGHKDKRYPYVSDIPLSDSQLPRKIKGELYEISNSCIPALDELEEHPHYYRRRPVSVKKMIDDTDVEASVYILFSESVINKIKTNFSDGFDDVCSGDWKAHGGI